jgi:hypothetical protein
MILPGGGAQEGTQGASAEGGVSAERGDHPPGAPPPPGGSNATHPTDAGQ